MSFPSFKLLCLGFLILLGGCKSPQKSALDTDLGPAGNAAVRNQVQNYLNKPDSVHCNPSGDGTRVIFAGYSLFQSFRYNISGSVVRSMANPRYWPDDVNLERFDPSYDGVYRENVGDLSVLKTSDFGGVASQRTLTIDGRKVTVCFILLEVVWDQAAAILLEEARRFKPAAIIMTGGGVTTTPFVGQFEGGALNRAMDLTGYDTFGQAIAINLPEIDRHRTYAPILEKRQPGVVDEIPMLWNQSQLAVATRPVAQTIRRQNRNQIFNVVAEPSARARNIYLCNNISYVALHAAKGVPISLAGGTVRFAKPKSTSADFVDRAAMQGRNDILEVDLAGALDRIKMVGFFHIPDTQTDEAQTMIGWAKLFAKVMTQVPN